MQAKYEWNRSLGGFGLWYGADESQAIVSTGEFKPDIDADYHVIKFGGDWGGLWATPQQWGNLSPKGGNSHKIVPFIYAVPAQWKTYQNIVGSLLALGFPAVILNCETEWQGFESTLYQVMSRLNCDSNLIGVCGYAWFNGWPDKGAAFAKALDGFNAVYLPEIYLSDWGGASDGIAETERDLSTLFKKMPLAPVWDTKAVELIRDNGGKPIINLGEICGESLWYHGGINAETMQTLRSFPPVSLTEPVVIPVKDQINTALGQQIQYINSLLEYSDNFTQAQRDLITAISDCGHTARKLNGGE